jgi:hypothetical protein
MISLANEQWRPVLNYEGHYEVSDLGRVRSIARVIPHKWSGSRTVPTRILISHTGTTRRHRYPVVDLRTPDHKRHTLKVHRLVLEAFIGPRPDGYVCCHANDDPADNRLDNLRWDTCSANTWDAVRNGCHQQTRKTHCRQDHEYTAANTYLRPNGGRGCRVCRSAAQRKYVAVRP